MAPHGIPSSSLLVAQTPESFKGGGSGFDTSRRVGQVPRSGQPAIARNNDFMFSSLNSSAHATLGAVPGWWQENAVLGRLSQLSRRFAAVKLLTRPLSAWRNYTVVRKPKRDLQYQREVALKLRLWLLRVRWRRYRHQLPLLHAVIRVTHGVLRPAWDRLRGQPSPEERAKLQSMALMKVVHGRLNHSIAQCHFTRSLLQRAFGSFFLATLQSDPERTRAGSRNRDWASAKKEDHGPLTVLVQLQHKCWRRWCHSTRMDLSREEWEGERHKGIVLLLMRNRTRSAMSLHFRVWSLLRRALEALLMNVDCEEHLARRNAPNEAGSARQEYLGFRIHDNVTWTGADQEIPRGTIGVVDGFTNCRVRVQFPRGTWRFEPSELLNVSASHSPRNQRPRRAPASRALRSPSKQSARNARRGLRGTSTAEVLRKSWWRWRFASVVEPFWEPSSPPEGQRPEGTTASLFQIAAEVEDARRLSSSLGFSAVSPRLETQGPSTSTRSHPHLEPSATAMVRHAAALPEEIPAGADEPPHLAMLQRALASFDYITTKTPPRQRPPQAHQRGEATEPASQRFAFANEDGGYSLAPLASEHSLRPAEIESLWSPGVSPAPAAEIDVTSGRGTTSATTSGMPSPRVRVPSVNGFLVADLDDELMTSPSARRRSRIHRQTAPELWSSSRTPVGLNLEITAPVSSPVEQESDPALLWGSGSATAFDDGGGSPVDLTIRQGMSRSGSTGAVGTPSHLHAYSEASGASFGNSARKDRRVAADSGAPEFFGNGHGDSSFVLSAHGGSSPVPSQDYGALKRGLRSGRR